LEVPPQKPTPVTATSDVAQGNETSEQLLESGQVSASGQLFGSNGASVEELVETDARVGIQTYGRLPIAFTKAKGARLWDGKGKEYLDFLGGIAVITVGHSHEAVTAAITRQAETLMHSSNLYYIEPQVKLAEKLHELSGGMRAWFCNSGAEANEAALKLARKHAKSKDAARYEIITTFDSFHGRTYGSLAATGQPKYHEGFEPMPGGFVYVHRNDVEALEAAVNERTAAILLEPIQGESGINPFSDAYLQRARELCDEHGLVLMFDEVQCGMGRTGKFFAHEWTGVRPDIVTLAKGLGNGVPIGALLAVEDVAASFVPGNHGCTFGGNFLSTAAALATIEVLQSEKLMQNSLEVGAYFTQQLEVWGEKTGIIKEVRGRGLMIGAELSKPVARDLMKACLENGLVFNAVGDTVLRFLPPLCITRADVDEAMTKLNDALSAIQ
jgi:predicted acetylornithine/succinylornithine family transaminase